MAKCTRCSGKGVIEGYGHVVGGLCFTCEGSGTKPTAELCAERARRQRLHGEGYAILKAATKGMKRRDADAVMDGRLLLEAREPERMVKANEALASGRVDAVAAALAAYWDAHKDDPR